MVLGLVDAAVFEAEILWEVENTVEVSKVELTKDDEELEENSVEEEIREDEVVEGRIVDVEVMTKMTVVSAELMVSKIEVSETEGLNVIGVLDVSKNELGAAASEVVDDVAWKSLVGDAEEVEETALDISDETGADETGVDEIGALDI